MAPTRTISMIAGRSGDIEPLFAAALMRRRADMEMLEVNPEFVKVAKDCGFYSERLMEKVAKAGGIRGIEEVPEDVRRVWATSQEIAPEQHVRMQAAFQKHTSMGISKIINLPGECGGREARMGHEPGYSRLPRRKSRRPGTQYRPNRRNLRRQPARRRGRGRGACLRAGRRAGRHVDRHIDRQSAPAGVDLGPGRPNHGDIRVTNAPLYDESGKERIGRVDLFSVLTDPADEPNEKAHMAEATATYTLPCGEISAQGLRSYPQLSGPSSDGVDAITGGTGKYAGVRGEVRLETRGNKRIITFRLID